MANINRPLGFRPVRHLNGSAWNGQVNLYYIPSTDANAYAVGDFVTYVGTTVNSDTGNTSGAIAYAPGTPIVARATASSTLLLGAIVGFKVDPTNLQNSGFNPASNANGRFVWVSDCPDIIYEGQLCGAAGAAVATNVAAAAGTCEVGLIGTIYAPAATANGGAGLSGMMLNQSTLTTAFAGTLHLKVFGYSKRIDQDLSSAGTYPKVEVIINNHFFGNITAGI
jgi:hypothetical protein